MRPRVRLAVSGMLSQIGTKVFKTSSVPILLTIILPKVGYAYCSKVEAHWALCFALLSSFNLISRNSPETVLNEGMTAGWVLIERGSIPLVARILFSAAILRASPMKLRDTLPDQCRCTSHLNVSAARMPLSQTFEHEVATQSRCCRNNDLAPGFYSKTVLRALWKASIFAPIKMKKHTGII